MHLIPLLANLNCVDNKLQWVQETVMLRSCIQAVKTLADGITVIAF